MNWKTTRIFDQLNDSHLWFQSTNDKLIGGLDIKVGFQKLFIKLEAK